MDRKTIFITGGASGIGLETARLFAERDWFVGLFDIDEPGLETARAELGADNAIAVALNVTDRAAWDAAVTQFSDATGGRMDLFFNNAGIGHGGPFDELDEAIAKSIIDINFQGVVNGVYACLPLLKATAKAHGRSNLVTTGSASGIIGAPGLAVYAATKFAVRGLTDSLNIELAPHGVAVSELQPWFLDTNILNGVETGGNRTGRDALIEGGVPIFSPRLAAEAVWDAASTEHPKIHHAVGGPAKRAQFMARLFPGLARTMMRRSAGDTFAGGGASKGATRGQD